MKRNILNFELRGGCCRLLGIKTQKYLDDEIPDSVPVVDEKDIPEEIEIPPTYKNLPVVAIGKNAFKDCGKITKVTIPESVRSIGFGAFANCTSLKSVTISKNVSEIGGYAFYNCAALEEINYCAKDVKDLGELNYVFYDSGLKTDARGFVLTIGKEVRSIPQYLFAFTFTHSIQIPPETPKGEIDMAEFKASNIVKRVRYEGTKKEYKRIYIGKFNNGLVFSDVECYDGTYRLGM